MATTIRVYLSEKVSKFYRDEWPFHMSTALPINSDLQGFYISDSVDPMDLMVPKLRSDLLCDATRLSFKASKDYWPSMPQVGSYDVEVSDVSINVTEKDVHITAPTWEKLQLAIQKIRNSDLLTQRTATSYLLERALEKQIAAEKVIKDLKKEIEKVRSRHESLLLHAESEAIAGSSSVREIGQLNAVVRRLEQDLAIANKRPWRRSANMAKSIWNRMCVGGWG